MLRKGVVEHIGAIMLVVISAAAIGGTLSSIQSHTVEPSQQGLMDQLQAYNQEATIENEEQFRGLVVWNMMAGQQCEYAPLLYQWDEEYELDEEDFDFQMVGSVNSIQDLDDREFTYYVEEDVLSEVIDETDFSGNCMGATPISMPMPEIVETALGYASLAAFWNWFEDETALAEWEGHSAQGGFGAADFTSEKTFRIDKEELMSFNIGGDLASSGSVRGNNAPDFVRAERAAVFQPEGILKTEETENRWSDEIGVFSSSDGHYGERRDAVHLPHMGEEAPIAGRGRGIYDYWEGNHVGWREAMNAFRVRMVNVPTVTTGEFNYDDLHSFEEDKWRQQYRYVVQNTDYIICEGASGFVQSNAGRDIEESGKEYSDDNPIYRDVVYPRVELRDQGDCLDDAFDRSYEGIGDRLRQHLEDDYPRVDDPNNYWPDVDTIENDDGTYSATETEMRLGEDSYMPVYRVYNPSSAADLNLDNWWDIGHEDEFYRLEWAINRNECPDESQVYDITKLHRIIGGTPSYEDERVELDQQEVVSYYTERFGEGNTFSLSMDTVDASDWRIVFEDKSDNQLSVYTNHATEGVEDIILEGSDMGWSDSDRISSQDSYRVVLRHHLDTGTLTLNIYGDEGFELTKEEDDSDFMKEIKSVGIISRGEGNSLKAEVEGKPKGCN